MNGTLFRLLPYLPETITRALRRADPFQLAKANELRLRAGLPVSLTFGEHDLLLSADGHMEEEVLRPLSVTEKELAACVSALCDGSVYAFSESMRQGFFTREGARIGIGGRMLMTNGIAEGFSSYSSLNIRLPRHVPDAADGILRELSRRGSDAVGGILVISPPGIGKTTVLRSLASALCRGYTDGGTLCRKRVCLVDEREELFLPEAFAGGLCDVLSGVPKIFGIELATRTLCPGVIVIDEIGGEKEAEELCHGAMRGIEFAASCHGKSVEDVLLRPGMRRLASEGVFDTAFCLSVEKGRRRTETVRLPEVI